MPLTDAENQRYARHLVLPGVGPAGQERLKAARVLLVGVGGLGSPVAQYLAAAGVGVLGIADADNVDLSNLQRQVLHTTANVGALKVVSAREAIHALNPLVHVRTIAERVTAENAETLIDAYDLVIDGTDNYETRYLLNDVCIRAGIPFIFGSVYRFTGQVAVFDRHAGPCYRCIFPTPPPDDAPPITAVVAGILGIVPGLIGVIQATEALKYLLGLGDLLTGRLLLVDALTMRFRDIRIAPSPECPVCAAYHLQHA